MNQCPICGRQYQGDACPHCAGPAEPLLCPRCGASYTGAYCPNGCNSPIAQHPYQQFAPPYPVPSPPPKKKRHTALIIVLVLLVLAAVAGSVSLYFYWQWSNVPELEPLMVEDTHFAATSEEFQQRFNLIAGEEGIQKYASTEKNGDRFYVSQLSDEVTLVLQCELETDLIKMINLQADWGADGDGYGSYIGVVMRLCNLEITEEQAQALLSDKLKVEDPLIGKTNKAIDNGVAYTLNASVKSLSFSALPEAALTDETDE